MCARSTFVHMINWKFASGKRNLQWIWTVFHWFAFTIENDIRSILRKYVVFITLHIIIVYDRIHKNGLRLNRIKINVFLLRFQARKFNFRFYHNYVECARCSHRKISNDCSTSCSMHDFSLSKVNNLLSLNTAFLWMAQINRSISRLSKTMIIWHVWTWTWTCWLFSSIIVFAVF